MKQSYCYHTPADYFQKCNFFTYHMVLFFFNPLLVTINALKSPRKKIAPVIPYVITGLNNHTICQDNKMKNTDLLQRN